MMTSRLKDFYKILGVARTATPDQIKKAFRQKAKQWHPDHNPGKRGEARFKELNEAHSQLSDPARRREYDELRAQDSEARKQRRMGKKTATRPAKRPAREPTAAEVNGKDEFGGIFQMFRGSGAAKGAKPDAARETPPSNGGSLETELPISLEEAVNGGSKRVTLALQERTGFLSKDRETRRTYDIKIPPGIRDGQMIRLKGKARAGGVREEDLRIRVRVSDHPIFDIEGDDLIAEVKLSAWEAALGASVRVPTLGGEVTMKIVGGVQSGQKLRLRGKGLPRKTKGSRGDIIYRAMIQVPTQMTPPEKAYFEKLRDVSRFNPRV